MDFQIDNNNQGIREIELAYCSFKKINYGKPPKELIIHYDDFYNLKQNLTLIYLPQPPYTIMGMQIIRTEDIAKGIIKLY